MVWAKTALTPIIFKKVVFPDIFDPVIIAPPEFIEKELGMEGMSGRLKLQHRPRIREVRFAISADSRSIRDDRQHGIDGSEAFENILEYFTMAHNHLSDAVEGPDFG
jgi:hypothetical protein